MKCPYCSVNIDDGVHFCPMCGASLGGWARTGAPGAAAPQTPQDNPYVSRGPAAETPDTARTALILSGVGLGFTLLGFFGLAAFVMCVIGVVLAGRSAERTGGSLCSQAQTARVCGWIGIALGALKLVAVVFMLGMMWRMIRAAGFPEAFGDLFREFGGLFGETFGEMFDTLAIL